MTSEEFRRLVGDRMDNACHDPMGRDAAIDEIVGAFERESEAAFQRGVDQTHVEYEGYTYTGE